MQIYTYPDPYVGKRKLKPIQFYIDANGCHVCISHGLMGGKKIKYPQIWRFGEPKAMHRYVYILEKGPIAKGMDIMHSCDNPKCFNILHLSVGTRQENLSDMVSKKRQAMGEKHGMAKLTAEQVLAIRDDPRDYAIIAKDYGVTRVHIRSIKKRLSWKWLRGDYLGTEAEASLQLR